MNITIIGTGYVGLTTGVVFNFLGHKVTCLDIDEKKIEKLKKASLPFYEPGLKQMLSLTSKKIHFTTEPKEAVADADAIFITVGTPSLSDGSPDLSFVREAARTIGKYLNSRTVVVNKSTVPIGSGNWVEALISEALSENGTKHSFAVASNPEFLREGAALHDALYPDRVVVGSDNGQALETLYALYKPVLEQTFTAPNFLPRPEGLSAIPFITTNLASAELIKYAANSFLALKISFINEIGELAERVGANITEIAKAIGLDKRIGARFLQAGIGWGGSCFGKDTAALEATAREYGIPMHTIRASREINNRQRERVVEKLLHELKILKGKTIGILGLAFKPQTDDLRESAALDIAKRLIERGVTLRVHDPVAMDCAREQYPDLNLSFQTEAEEVAQNADAIILATEWPEYRDLNWENISKKMRQPLLLDGRNFLDKERLIRAGFRYLGIGR
ncbi:MAG: UDP-glucose/GDP-mannose dehydrogenase family protein [Deltaproteobacteria bacterium]|nr:UDP-glucose/GDP-mannose dehydrogenase family protein [Deltaproteobacteria bacterium]